MRVKVDLSLPQARWLALDAFEHAGSCTSLRDSRSWMSIAKAANRAVEKASGKPFFRPGALK